MSSAVVLKNVNKGPPWYKSSRYLLAILAAIGYSHFFFQRVNLSMAIVCMVNHTAVDILQAELVGAHEHANLHANGLQTLGPESLGFPTKSVYNENGSTQRVHYRTESKDQISVENIESVKSSCQAINMNGTEREDGELVWTKETQGIILGGLYWGYAVIQLPSQRIIQKIGSKWMALMSVLVLSTMTMIGPWAAQIDPWALMSVRIIQGFASALGIPAIYAIWGQWAPPDERTKLMSICFSGSMIANAIVYPTSSHLCRHGFGGGWPSVFYIFGLVGFFWCILWMLFVFETPESHPRIDANEKKYIMASLGYESTRYKGAVPWLTLLKSPPVWAVVSAQLGYDYAFFMLLAVLPQYMREVLKFDIESNGLFTMMPHIVHYIITSVWGYTSATLMAKRKLSVGQVRKLSTIIGDAIPAALFIVISFLDCSHAMIVVILMSCAIGISGTNMQGFMINPYDIAPKYATAILCLSNTVAVASGIVSPFLVAALTKDETREQWQIVFFLTSGISLSCLFFYLVCGSGEQMEWTQKESENDLEMNATRAKSVSMAKTELANAECHKTLIGESYKDSAIKLTNQNGYACR